MRPIAEDVARSVVCVSVRASVCVYVVDRQMCCAETAELIEMPFGGDYCDGTTY